MIKCQKKCLKLQIYWKIVNYSSFMLSIKNIFQGLQGSILILQKHSELKCALHFNIESTMG